MKKRIKQLAVRDNITLLVMLDRMLELYEKEHGKLGRNENARRASCRAPEARYASDQTTSGRCQARSADALLRGARRPP